jgi:hypothetical protein
MGKRYKFWSARSWLRGGGVLCSAGLLCAAGLISGAMPEPGVASEPAADAAAAPAALSGSWRDHEYQFNYMGFTATYSCDGLGDKLQRLLSLSGARPDAKVMPSCVRGFGVPDKLAQAQLKFATLLPAPPTGAGAGDSVDGVWRHVEISARHPFELQSGDCELVEQFRDRLLPMFATHNVRSQITCVPHQDSGSNYSLSFDVFAAAPAPARNTPASESAPAPAPARG